MLPAGSCSADGDADSDCGGWGFGERARVALSRGAKPLAVVRATADVRGSRTGR